MHLNSRGGVSIAELIFYLPCFFLSIWVCKRHGFSRSSGWIYTLILCLVRIVGAGCQLSTYSSPTKGLIEATLILDSIGISPLLLATLGLLSRLVDSINRTHSRSFLGVKHFRILQLLIAVGLILSIAGGTSISVAPDGKVKIPTTSKIGIILYIVAFVGIVLVCLFVLKDISLTESGEKRVAGAVVLALPFILVRMAYSALAVFVHNHDFNVLNGKVVFLVVMSVMEEMVVVLLYLLLGLKADAAGLDKKGPIESRPWKRNRHRGGQAPAPERV